MVPKNSPSITLDTQGQKRERQSSTDKSRCDVDTRALLIKLHHQLTGGPAKDQLHNASVPSVKLCDRVASNDNNSK